MRFSRPTLLSVTLLSALLATSAPAQELIDSLTLNEAIRAALAKNYTIKAQAAGTNASRADLSAEWGAFHPGFRGTYTYSNDGSPQPTDPFSGNRPPSSLVESDAYSLGVGGVTPWGLNYTVSAYSQNQGGTFNAFADNYFDLLPGQTRRVEVLNGQTFTKDQLQIIHLQQMK